MKIPFLSKVALAASFALSLHAAEPPRQLRVGVEGAYPPFSSVAADGSLKGFDIDIARAVCAEMKVECKLVQQDFDGMIPALQAKKFDVIVASLSITPERLKVVDFSDKYYKTPNRLVARAGSKIDGSAAAFAGTKIGVQRSSINDRYATAKFESASIVRYAKQDEVWLDLAAGRIDATLVDAVAADVGFLKTPAGKGFAFTGPAYVDPEFFGRGVGIALRKNEPELKARLDAALKAIRAGGGYRSIQDRYFDFDVYGQ